MYWNIRLVLVFVVIACLLVGSSICYGAASKPRVILAPILDKSIPEEGKTKVDGVPEAIVTALKEALFKSGKFTLIADADLQKDLDADRYNQYLSGDFNPSQAAAIGMKVGAQALVKCTIITNQFSKKVKDMIIVKETENRMELTIAVEICNIELTTICFMDKSTADVKSKSKDLVLDNKPGGQSPISLSNANDVRVQAINTVAADLAAKIVANAVKEKGKGTITSVKGAGKQDDSIIVDIGSNAGAEVDTELTIMGVDEDGFEDTIGKAMITNTMEDKSKAVILEVKRAVAQGDRVQIAAGSGGNNSAGGSSPGITSETIASGQGMNKDAAINDALTQAIQQVAGVYIMSEQEAKNYEMIKNEIFSSTKGYIAKYEVVSGPMDDGGITTVKVKAMVSNKPVFDALLARRIVSRQRVMVIVPEQHLKMIVPDPAGETQIIKTLIDKNFLVVDQKLSEQIRGNEKDRAVLHGDANMVLALLGNKTDAEVLIYGEAFSEGAQRVTTGSGQKFTCGARVEVRAVETDTGRILYADAAQATSVDATEALAGKRALKAAAELLCNGKDGGKGFVDSVMEKLLDTTHYVQCVVSGIQNEQDLSTVEDGLREVIGNRPLHRYSYADGIARLNLETSKTAQEVSSLIAKLDIKGKLTLVSSTMNKIELQYSQL